MPENGVVGRQILIQQTAPPGHQTGWGLALIIELGAHIMIVHFIGEDSKAQRSPVDVLLSPIFSHKGKGVSRKPSRSIQIEWGEMLENWEWGKGPLHVRMMSMDLFCSAQRAPEPQLPLAWLGSQVHSNHSGLGEVAGLHLPICKTGGLDSTLFKKPSSPEVGWVGLERGFQKGGLFSSDLTSCLFG